MGWTDASLYHSAADKAESRLKDSCARLSVPNFSLLVSLFFLSFFSFALSFLFRDGVAFFRSDLVCLFMCCFVHLRVCYLWRI